MKNNTVLYSQCTHNTPIKERGDDVQFSLLRHSTLIAIPSLAFQTTDSPSNHNSSLYLFDIFSYCDIYSQPTFYVVFRPFIKLWWQLQMFSQAMLVAKALSQHCIVWYCLDSGCRDILTNELLGGIHHPQYHTGIHNPSPRRRREREMSEDLEQTQSIFIEPPHS